MSLIKCRQTAKCIHTVIRKLHRVVPPHLSEPMIPNFTATSDSSSTWTDTPECTVLSNGLKVVTLDFPSAASAVGLYAELGSQDESMNQRGMSHVLEKVAFSSSKSFPGDILSHKIRSFGSSLSAVSSREDFALEGSIVRSDKNLNDLLNIYSDIVACETKVDGWGYPASNVEEAKLTAMTEWKDVVETPDEFVLEKVQQVGFDGGLSNPRIYSSDCVPWTAKDLSLFVASHFSPNHAVLCATGVEHDRFLRMAKEHFSHFKKDNNRCLHKSSYRGGSECRIERRDRPMNVGEHIPLLTTIALGYEGCGITDEDYIVFHVMKSLLGGGSSFSSGGPGKGLYTRLYRDVLCTTGWIFSASCFFQPFRNTGMFGILASAPHQFGRALVEVIVREIYRLRDSLVTDVELLRAKRQLQSILVMMLEQRGNLCEDIGRQTLCYGKWIGTKSICDKIDAVSAKDVRRVADLMLDSKPTLCVHGQTSQLPSVESL